MSLAINAATPEGIVLATDSRQSYRNRKGQARIGSDNAIKLFQLGRAIGAAITGPAFLPEGGVQKNISKFVEEFKKETKIDSLTIEEITNKIHSFFDKKYHYREELEKLPERIKSDLERQGCKVLEIVPKKDIVRFRFRNPQGKIQEGAAGVNQIAIIIAGYNKDRSQQVFITYIPGKVEEKRNSKKKGKEYGASWAGQYDVVARIVLGRDPRTFNLPIIQEQINTKGKDEILKQFNGLEYAINWGTMTLQDAVDFCTLAIETTSAIQRFSDGIVADPGNIPGVGGSIDLAVITPEKGFIWVNKKNLRIEESEVDLDKLPDLPPVKPKKKKK